MAKQKFNFQSSLNSASAPVQIQPSNLDAGSIARTIDTPLTKNPLDSYKIIPRNKIRFNKRNDYPLDEIEKLMEMILHYGVLQDILVIYSIEEDIYIVEAGHRRTTALDLLVEKYKNWNGESDDPDYILYKKNVSCYEAGYVCKVIDRLKENIDYDLDDENLDESVIDSEIRLIITNEGAREISPPVRAKNIQRLSRLLELKNKGKENPVRININATIAEQMNITERQVINYKNTEKLIPELKTLFEQERISLKLATAYSALDEDAQREIFLSIQSGHDVNIEQVRSLKQETEKLKKELQNKQQEIESIKKAVSGEPGSPDVTNTKALCSLLSKNIAASIKDLISSMDMLLSQDPALKEWIENQKKSLRDLL